jgi:transposase
MSEKFNATIAVIGIDIGKNSFHAVGLDERGAIVLRQTWSRGQVEARLANIPPRLIGMEACVGAHHLSRRLKMLGHDARLMPAKYVRPYSKDKERLPRRGVDRRGGATPFPLERGVAERQGLRFLRNECR